MITDLFRLSAKLQNDVPKQDQFQYFLITDLFRLSAKLQKDVPKQGPLQYFLITFCDEHRFLDPSYTIAPKGAITSVG